jgi:16S rRNA processing protein RimM
MAEPRRRGKVPEEGRRPPEDVEGAPFGTPEHLVIARVLGARGLRGELKCRIVTEFTERFRPRIRVFLGSAEREHRVLAANVAPPHVFLKLSGVRDRTTAESLRGLEVLVAVEDAVPLPEGRFYWHEVIGLEVVDGSGNLIGTVRDIIETGANDVYLVDGAFGEVLVPNIEQVVRSIDVASGRMTIDPLPGMLPKLPSSKN